MKLIKTYDNYSAWVRRACKNVGLRTISTAIVELQALIDLEVSEQNKNDKWLQKVPTAYYCMRNQTSTE